MTSILSSAYNMLPNMPTWIGGGGASTAVSKPAPTKPRRGWWGRGGAAATDKTTAKTDTVQEKAITPSPTDRTTATTTKATTRKNVSSPVGTAPTIPPTGKEERGTEPGDTTATPPAASTGWFSRAPRSSPLFRDDRGWISAWPLTSHKAVNKDFSWKGLTSDQVGELYDLHSRYYGAKKPDHWEFASEASKYLHDTEQASKFYRETVFAGGRVPKELVSVSRDLGHLLLHGGGAKVSRLTCRPLCHPVSTRSPRDWSTPRETLAPMRLNDGRTTPRLGSTTTTLRL